MSYLKTGGHLKRVLMYKRSSARQVPRAKLAIGCRTWLEGEIARIARQGKGYNVG